MKLQPEPFEAIKAGEKIIESRLFDEKRQQIKIGDIIEFKKNTDLKDSIQAEVIALLNYPNFEELFSDFPASLFGKPTNDGLLEEVEEFYSKGDQEKFGVLGIKIKLL